MPWLPSAALGGSHDLSSDSTSPWPGPLVLAAAVALLFAIFQGRKGEALAESSAGAYGGLPPRARSSGSWARCSSSSQVLFVLSILITGGFSYNFETS